MPTMSVGPEPQAKALISQTAFYATTGTFFGIAVVAAAARAFIRIHHLKLVHADDYLFFVATAALIAAGGLFYPYLRILFKLRAVSEGSIPPPQNFSHEVESTFRYALLAEPFSWTAVFAVKFSFLFYFRALVKRLYKLEAWWWFTFAVFIPVTATMIPGTFIVCPHTGPSILLYCASTAGFLPRERGYLYCSVTADIVTDIMLISIPIIVLRKSSLNLSRKLSIAVVLCLSLLMVVLALVRGISASVVSTEDRLWDPFLIQLEGSISVIAACPVAFRSLFIVNRPPKNNPDRDNQVRRSAFERLGKKTMPKLQSIRTGATLTGMRTLIRGDGNARLKAQDDGGYALSPPPAESISSSQSLEAPKRSAEAIHEPVQAV